ncbi:MAG: hypothetical protein OXB95_11435 [Rhodobacteraceae bacterium]|nr:hypothetical protein [Paracoccaceae bacterium]
MDAHEAVFGLVQEWLNASKLIKGKLLGVFGPVLCPQGGRQRGWHESTANRAWCLPLHPLL